MLVEISGSSVEFISAFTLIASIGCVMMMARLLVYVYRTYTCTTVTAQAFNYVRASRHTAGRYDVCPSQDCVLELWCRDQKSPAADLAKSW